MILLSARNPRVQRVRRLARRHRARVDERAFVLEGPHVVDAALSAGVPIEALFHEAGADAGLLARARAAGVEVHELEPGTLARVTDVVTPQPVVAVAPWCDSPLEAVLAAARAEGGPARPVVVLLDVRDPGNAGTLLRTGEASGAAGVVAAGHSVDVFNPKCVRASVGALFHLPVALVPDAGEALAGLRSAGLWVIATAASAELAYDRCDLTGPIALLLGNEAAGLPPEVQSGVDEVVGIPIEGRAESLNVAAAGAVLCFEAARQRRSGSPNGGPTADRRP